MKLVQSGLGANLVIPTKINSLSVVQSINVDVISYV